MQPSSIRDVRIHHKPRSSNDELQTLSLVAGPGVVPLLGASETSLELAAARCSVADLLAARGRLRADETRGIGHAAAHALRRIHAAGAVHGDVKPANLLLHDDGLWLADFDAAGPVGTARRRSSPSRPASAHLDPADDVAALVHALIECATGVVVDPEVEWSALDLVGLGCPADLAAELALARRRATEPDHLMALLDTSDARLPSPTAPVGADSTPTIDVNLDDWW